MPRRMLQQFRFADAGAGFQLHVGHRQFADLVIGLANGGGHGHGRMLVQGFLDHLRVDVVAAADDQVLAAAGKPDVAIGVDTTEVAGIEPVAVDPDVLVLVRLQIALEYGHAAHAEVADLVGGGVAQVAPLLVEHRYLHLAVGHAHADGAGPALAMGGVAAAAAGPFRKAVAFDQPQAGLGLELADQLHRHRRRATQGIAQAGEVMALAGHLQQARVDGRHAAEEAHPVALDDPPEVLDQARIAVALRRGNEDLGTGEEGREAGDHHAVDVEQRQAAEGVVALPQVDGVGEDHRHGHFVAVTVGGQLGRARGTAGMEVGGDVIRGDQPAAFQAVGGEAVEEFVEVQHALGQRAAQGLDGTAPRLGQQVGQVHRDYGFQLRQPVAQAGHLVPEIGAGEWRQGHQHPGIGRMDQLGDVLGLQQRVDGVDYARRLATPEGEVGLRQVRQQEGHRLARPHAQMVEGIGGLGDPGQQFCVGQLEGRFLGIALEQEGHGALVRVTFGAATDQLVGAVRHAAFFQ
ncbi:hypothetical protein D3C85_703700 [compost metagenome]